MRYVLTLIVAAVSFFPSQALLGQDEGQIDFVRDIKPILERRCTRCHAESDDIDLSWRDAVIDSYVFAEDLEGSDFYMRMVTDDEDSMMPPPEDGGPMPREETMLVRLWILEGAEWPEDVELLSPEEAAPDDSGNSNQTGDEFVRRIDFENDIRPILETKCLECHGSVNPAEGADFSTRRKVIGSFVIPGELSSSSLYTRMVTENQSKLMPPIEHGGPLSHSEIKLIEMWIDEGAEWPEEAILGEIRPEAPAAKSLVGRAWAFQGFFHPATVHFPVALLSIAALFVVLQWMFGGSFRDAAFYCLLFGAISSVFASLMGWAASANEGFGNDPFDFNSASFRHRWFGVGVSIFSVVVAVMAMRVRTSATDGTLERAKKDLPWQIGVLLVAALVGITGHQGGELQYGEGWYDRAFALFTDPAEESGGAADADGENVSSDDSSPSEEDSDDESQSGDEQSGDEQSGDEQSGDEQDTSLHVGSDSSSGAS